MKYLLLAWGDEKKLEGMSERELAALGAECRPYNDELRRSGRVVAMGSLAPTRMSTTIRTRNGRLLTTDGPFVETREQLGGFLIIEARDLNDAIRIASRHPAALLQERLGWVVELRPFEQFELP
jgi:hypothetical protein